MAFDTGVKSYILAKCEVYVQFPVDWKGNEYVCCNQCYYFNRQSGRCRLNNEVCEFPDKYVGSRCPLERIGEADNSNDEGKEEA